MVIRRLEHQKLVPLKIALIFLARVPGSIRCIVRSFVRFRPKWVIFGLKNLFSGFSPKMGYFRNFCINKGHFHPKMSNFPDFCPNLGIFEIYAQSRAFSPKMSYFRDSRPKRGILLKVEYFRNIRQKRDVSA